MLVTRFLNKQETIAIIIQLPDVVVKHIVKLEVTGRWENYPPALLTSDEVGIMEEIIALEHSYIEFENVNKKYFADE